jgi:hypothetical protein
MNLAKGEWPRFLPAAVVAAAGLCWAAPAVRRGLPARALTRMTATAVLSFGVTLETCKVIVSLVGR